MPTQDFSKAELIDILDLRERLWRAAPIGSCPCPRWGGIRCGSIVMQEIAIEPGAAGRRWRGVALVAGAAAVWSIAGIITRLTATDVWTTLFWRSTFAAAFLCCYIALKEQGDWREFVDTSVMDELQQEGFLNSVYK